MQVFAHLWRCLQHICGPHTCGNQRLVCVSHCGVGEQDPFLGGGTDPLCHRFWAFFIEDLLRIPLGFGCRFWLHLQKARPWAISWAFALEEGVSTLQCRLCQELEDLKWLRSCRLCLLLLLSRCGCQSLALCWAVLLEFAHASELLIPLVHDLRHIHLAKLLQTRFNKGADVAHRVWEGLAVLAILLPNHIVNHTQLLQLWCVDVLLERQTHAILGELHLLLSIISISPKDACGSLGGDSGIVCLRQHADLVAHRNGQCST
mmetsp:Transcript_43619/g.100589  ORF Transcript_43619/g.100589 Transcript_43619/m.100589 type:complete len:261 (+) Transcript_43619:1866-2648(+)